jgi:hypothetical protein
MLRTPLRFQLLLLLAVGPGLAWAQPALVIGYGATAYGGPDHSAVPVAELPRGTRVEATGPAVRGFRRIRLPDGKEAFVEELALLLSEAVPAEGPAPTSGPVVAVPAGVPDFPRDPAPAPSPEPGARPDLRARIYIGDFPQLAAMVRQDQALAARADELDGRRTAAGVLGAGALASIVVLPLLSFSDTTCDDVGMGMRSCHPQARLAVAGLIGGAVLGVVALAVAPSRGEILDLLSRWNLRHPDRQLVPDPWIGATVATVPAETMSPPPPPFPEISAPPPPPPLLPSP